MNKLIVISAPSGTGKSTLINRLLSEHPEFNLRFSISATSRLPRGNEKNGVEYQFLTPEEFKKGILEGEFIEYEEVYKDKFYGTREKEVEALLLAGANVLFDIDTIGAMNIKKNYGSNALCIFIIPPSIEELRRRLTLRATDSFEIIEERIEKACKELSKSHLFDKVILNDDFQVCYEELVGIISSFLQSANGLDDIKTKHIEEARVKSGNFFHLKPNNWNCAQALIKGFQKYLKIEDEEIEDKFRSMGGGKAPNGYCGALYAANYILERTQLPGVANEFEKIAGSCTCKGIKGEGGSKYPCSSCVSLADSLVEEKLRKIE